MLAAAVAILALAAPAAAAPSLALQPERVRPGDALLVTVRGASAPPAGTLGDRPLAFYPIPGGFRALVALSVDATPGTLPVAVEVAGGGAAAERLQAAVEVVEPGFRSKELGVAKRFIEPPPAARRRMKTDQAAFQRAFAREFSPPLFSGNFAPPRDAEVTGRFGDKRTFNGVKKSQHYGDDLHGALGDPVAAANDGTVVLARDCYASGRSVVVWHGARTFTVYFHLSKVSVRPGQAVKRGQLLGLVGQSGRVTGPHLHWGVKIADLYVDPESVLRLDFASDGGAPSTATPSQAAAPNPAAAPIPDPTAAGPVPVDGAPHP